MNNISENLRNILQKLPVGVILCAVSKFHPINAIEELYGVGQRVFGENRPQELTAKAAVLPTDIEWHFIGHLQTNKVKMVVPHAELIESVDSLRLLEAIDKEAEKCTKIQKILLQMHIATEDTKQGFLQPEIQEILKNTQQFENIEIVGLMGMASLSADTEQIKREFNTLATLYHKYPTLTTLSMGMSGDWEVALECGSNNIRVGSAIFGARH